MERKPGIIISIIVGGIVGFAAMRLLGFGGFILTWIFIFVAACAGGWIYQRLSAGELRDTDKT